MNLVINPQAPLPIYAQIVEQVKDLILSGQMNPGETLPSVRQLAENLEVNSLTIQKAYKNLEAAGLIAIKKGVGAFVQENLEPRTREAKDEILKEELRPIINKAKTLGCEKTELKSLIDKLWE